MHLHSLHLINHWALRIWYRRGDNAVSLLQSLIWHLNNDLRIVIDKKHMLWVYVKSDLSLALNCRNTCTTADICITSSWCKRDSWLNLSNFITISIVNCYLERVWRHFISKLDKLFYDYYCLIVIFIIRITWKNLKRVLICINVQVTSL